MARYIVQWASDFGEDGYCYCEGAGQTNQLARAHRYQSIDAAKYSAWYHAQSMGGAVEVCKIEADDSGEVITHQYTVKPLPRFVSVYDKHHCYGGPEEGGWYYWAYECLASIPIEYEEWGPDRSNASNIDDIKAKLAQWFRVPGHGYKYGVGDTQRDILTEHQPKQHETKGRPIYE